MKNLLLILVLAASFVACNNSGKKKASADNKSAEKQACSSVDVDSFLVIAENYIGKEISVCGTVDHVCKHGGKKVKLFSTCPSKYIKGLATEKIGTFEPDIEGSNICIKGVVVENKIDMASLDEWEAQIKAQVKEQKKEEATEGCSDHNPAIEQIEKQRKMVDESEKGYLPYYTIDVAEYHVCKTEKTACCDKKAEEKKGCCPSSEKTEAKAAEKSGCSDKKMEEHGCAGSK